MPRLVVAALAAAVLFASPAAAHAASVSVSNGVLTYTAQAGATNNVALAQTGSTTVTVTRLAGDTDVFGGGAGCTLANGTDTCTGVTSVSADAGVWAIAVYLVVQTVDGYVIVPYVARRTVDLAPALVLGAQLLASALFGILGLMLADPMLAMIKVALERKSVHTEAKGPALA